MNTARLNQGTPLLLNAVSKHYAENIVLNQLDLHIPAGQFVAVWCPLTRRLRLAFPDLPAGAAGYFCHHRCGPPPPQTDLLEYVNPVGSG